MRRRQPLFLIVSLVLVLGFLSFKYVSATQLEKVEEPGETVLVGVFNTSTFEQAVESAKPFYSIFREALDNSKKGDHDTAIKLYNEAIPQAVLGPELAMVYGELTEIYRAKGDLESELKYIELDIKYSMNEDLNKEHQKRATEIRQLLASKAQSSQT